MAFLKESYRNNIPGYRGEPTVGDLCRRNGVPKSSVIAVTLFLIAVEGAFLRLLIGVFIFVCADNIVVMAIGVTFKGLRRKLGSAVSRVGAWDSDARFQLSAHKRGFIVQNIQSGSIHTDSDRN